MIIVGLVHPLWCASIGIGQATVAYQIWSEIHNVTIVSKTGLYTHTHLQIELLESLKKDCFLTVANNCKVSNAERR